MKFLRFLKKIWLGFAHILGTVNTFLLLLVIYIVVIGVYAIIYKPFKWIGILIMRTKKVPTYWSTYEHNKDYNYPF